MSALLCLGAAFVTPGPPAYADADGAIGRPDPVEAEPHAAPAATDHHPAAAKPHKVAIPLPRPAPGAPVNAAGAKQESKQEIKAATTTPPVSATSPRESRYGWTVTDDAATGIRLGLPRKLVPIEQATREGTRFTSRHGDIQVETFRIANGLTLGALFAMERSKPRPRRVEVSSLRDQRFSLSGMQGLRRFAMHAQAENGEIRGFTVSYDQALEGMLTPLATAMADSFVAFAPGIAPPIGPAQRVAYGSGVIVSAAGDIVTDRALTEDCQTITVAHLGPAERVATRGNIALLRVYGARNLSPAPTTAAGSDSDVIVRAFPDPQTQDGRAEIKETRARLVTTGAAMRLDPMPAVTSAGAGVFDTEGRLIGLLSPKGVQLASAEAVAPTNGLTPASVVQDLLPTTATPGTPPAASMVRIVCVRPQ